MITSTLLSVFPFAVMFGFEEAVCFVNEGSEFKLVEQMLERLELISKTAYAILFQKNSSMFSICWRLASMQEKILFAKIRCLFEKTSLHWF